MAVELPMDIYFSTILRPFGCAHMQTFAAHQGQAACILYWLLLQCQASGVIITSCAPRPGSEKQLLSARHACIEVR